MRLRAAPSTSFGFGDVMLANLVVRTLTMMLQRAT
jgi:hypothetical protein